MARRGRALRRLLWLLGGGVGLLLVLLLVLSLAAGPLARRLALRALEEDLRAEAAIDRLDLDLRGRLLVRGLALRDLDGRTIATVDELEGRVRPLGLLRGRLEGALSVRGFELHAWRDARGDWNLAGLPREGGGRDRGDGGGGSDGGDELAEVDFDLDVRDGRVVVHGADGTTSLEDVELRAEIDGLEAPAPVELSASVRGPDGSPGGSLGVRGTLTAAPTGRLEATSARGVLALELRGLSGSALAPAAALVLPVRELAGTLEGTARVELEPGPRLRGAVDLALAGLAVRGPRGDAPPFRLARATLTGEATADGAGAGAQHLSLTADDALTLRYDGRLAVPEAGGGRRDAEGTLAFEADGARLAELARGWLPERSELALAGRLAGELRGSASLPATRGGTTIHVEGSARTPELVLRLPLGEHVLEGREPPVGLVLEADLEPGPDAVLAARLELASSVVAGTLAGTLRRSPGVATDEGDGAATLDLEDARAELTYVPARLEALAGPLLPGRLTGEAPQPLAFTLELPPVPATPPPGAPGGATADELLRALVCEGTLGVGDWATNGLVLGGELALEARGGRARVHGTLDANGGTVAVEGELPLVAGAGAGERAEGGPSLSLVADDVEANAELSPLLARLHPAFAAADAVRGSRLAGRISSELSLSLADGELARGGLAALAGAPADALLADLSGEGRFAIVGARLAGSPLLESLLAELGLDAREGLDVEPTRFLLRAGRISYPDPWTWTIEGTRTSFEGSVGLDLDLDLAWTIPITEPLIERHEFLSFLEGRSFTLPIRGTATRPRLEVDDALRELARQAGRSELQRRLGLGGIGGAGGGRDAGRAEEDSHAGPAELLRRADAQWEAGERAEAARLYRRLKERYEISLVYLLNRDRIRERAKHGEDG